MDKNTSAIRAHKQSIANAMAGNKEAWLALFDDNATVHDPVGKSDHDPEGKGFQGKERIAEFWDMMIGPGDLTIVPHKRYPCGDDIVAVAMTATNHIGGLKTFIEMIATYEVNAEGKLIRLQVYWDVEALSEQIPT
jgi:ketosteroid isomerase-like protein